MYLELVLQIEVLAFFHVELKSVIGKLGNAIYLLYAIHSK